jgi:hypothetical protein
MRAQKVQMKTSPAGTIRGAFSSEVMKNVNTNIFMKFSRGIALLRFPWPKWNKDSCY